MSIIIATLYQLKDKTMKVKIISEKSKENHAQIIGEHYLNDFSYEQNVGKLFLN